MKIYVHASVSELWTDNY